MSFKKGVSAVTSAFLALIIQINASASILGDLTGGYKETLASDIMFHEYNYNTDTTTQAEYFVEYTPNDTVVPVVINGDATTAGSRRQTFARMGSMQPTSFATITVRVRADETTSESITV